MASDTSSAGGEPEGGHAFGGGMAESTVGRAVLARWKHAIATAIVGLTTWALYEVGGGWTLDATVFGAATVGIVLYSLLTLRSDLD